MQKPGSSSDRNWIMRGMWVGVVMMLLRAYKLACHFALRHSFIMPFTGYLSHYLIFMARPWPRPFATLLCRCASFSIAQMLTVVLKIERTHSFALLLILFGNKRKTLRKHKVHKAVI